MWKIFKYSFYDMVRNRWVFVYMTFFLIVSLALLFLSRDHTNAIVSLSNIVLSLTPMIGILFGAMYYYNSIEFIRLLMAQPLSRKSIFSGMYLGLASSLCISLLMGVVVPFSFFGIWVSSELIPFLFLCGVSVVLSLIFSLLGFLIANKFENKIKGIGIAIFLWLFFAIIYDGLFLLLLLFFKDYPLENLTIGLSLFNPIDLSRILIILKMDLSAMMGYTGAVLQKFIGSTGGSVLIMVVLLLWILVPYFIMIKQASKKDF